jgi:hypothetical protein
MITFKHKGNFNNTEAFFKRDIVSNYTVLLEKYAKEGVKALADATPRDSGKTADSWSYSIKHYPDSRKVIITWLNDNISEDIPVAILIQYGHGTKDGGFVQGIDFINPTMRPIFNKIADEAWKEVTK